MTSQIRSVVRQSWRRSAAAGVSADLDAAPLALDTSGLAEQRENDPLSAALQTIDEVLGPAARDCDAVLAVFDRMGQMLWSTGSRTALRRAETIGFVNGSSWDERLVGTNAPGLAIALDQPVQVRGPEHFRDAVKRFGCVAVPIHDPASGRVIGALDLTGAPDIVVPQSMAAILATARLAEGLILPIIRPPRLKRTQLRLSVLGRDRALLNLGTDGEREQVELSPRHSEILLLLAERPDGMTGDELAVELYEDDMATSTLRAELNRLKVLLGEGVLTSRPYRLGVEIVGDWRQVLDDVAQGRPHQAMASYVGAVLPRSQAPGVSRIRDRVAFAARQSVLDSADAALLARWTSTAFGADDYEMWQAQVSLLPAGTAMHTMARGQLARLDLELT